MASDAGSPEDAVEQAYADGDDEFDSPAPPAAAEMEAAAAAGAAALLAEAAPDTSAEAAVAAAYGYGAAAESLIDPACRQGTEAFAAAKAAVTQLLQQYRTRVRQLEAVGQSKPDMRACADLRDKQPARRYGLAPGVAVGDTFKGRGEMAMLGLHTQTLKGVDAIKGGTQGAYAICLSGGYKDDSDDGHTFWYTGVGGQGQGSAKRHKQQVSDQSYDTPDNAALVRNYVTRTPVRVFRHKQRYDVLGKPLPGPCYVYDGLYQVMEHKREPSKDGPLVCRFLMKGVPGHSVVSSRVTYSSPAAAAAAAAAGSSRQLKAGTVGEAFRRLLLAEKAAAAAAARGGRPAKQQRREEQPTAQPDDTTYPAAPQPPSREGVAARVAERAAAGTHGRLVDADISGGQEQVPIPMWNAVDGDDSIPLGAHDSYPLEDGAFAYTQEYTFGEQAAQDLARQADLLFARLYNSSCGIQYHSGCGCYTADGCLSRSEPSGVMECDPHCTGHQQGTADACRANMVLQQGIVYPLEVFKTPSKGWGVRCSVDVPVGALLCPYIGIVVTDSTAELLRELDPYLMNLDHFHTVLQDGQQQQQQQQQGEQQGEQDEEGDDQQQHGEAPSLAAASAAAAAAAGADGPPPQQQQQQQQQWGEPQEAQQQPGVSPQPQPQQQQPQQQPFLVVDASHEGNVGRFINHSCDPNCLLQPVLARNARSHLLYYVAVVAQQDIPAFTELTYNYQYQNPDKLLHTAQADPAAAAAAGGGPAGSGPCGVAGGRRRPVLCQCGAANCRKWLLP